ncbi:hypothetical protein [Streptomyces sp. NPDC127084]|uniref:hypothetical protein n=1 Tax=Streptomyces sp. NPDC127084 TaxID=3347133 RepID=UPI00364D915F
MGRALALDLPRRGGTLLLHGRDPDRLEAATAAVRAAAPGTTVRGCLADLFDLDQMHAVADRIQAPDGADAQPARAGLRSYGVKTWSRRWMAPSSPSSYRNTRPESGLALIQSISS